MDRYVIGQDHCGLHRDLRWVSSYCVLNSLFIVFVHLVSWLWLVSFVSF